MEPVSINFFYYDEDFIPSLANKVYETIQTIFSTAIIKNEGHSYEIPLKWNFRLISSKTTSEIQCDILAVFCLALDVGRPEQKQKAGFLESGVKAGFLMKSGALLFLNVMSRGVNLQEYTMRTDKGFSDFFTEKDYSEELKKFPFKSCSIDVNSDLEVVKKNIKSDIAQGKKASAYQNNMPEIKLMIDNVIQKKFNNMPQKEREKYIKPPIQEGTKSSPQPAMQPKVNSGPDIVPIQVQPPVPLLLQEGAKSSSQPAMQSKVNPERDERVEAFAKWKNDNPEIAKYLPNETASERFKRLWPLFNKS